MWSCERPRPCQVIIYFTRGDKRIVLPLVWLEGSICFISEIQKSKKETETSAAVWQEGSFVYKFNNGHDRHLSTVN